ncbi:hypothetical protein PG993_008495 [Apiospora rasikravindrae]|uniref:Heterokaryon incompatibility domain-containing protein n=1 Tax=Apiospora rasikravindrae TaxID=990691 RepID=A0ABR1T2F1_9PEZI
MAASNKGNAEQFRICYFADAFYGSRPGWLSTARPPPTVFEVPHAPHARFVLTLEIKTSVLKEDDEAERTGYINVAFVLTERAPTAPDAEVTTEAVYSQHLTHCQYRSSYADMMVSLRDGEPEVNAQGVLFGSKAPSAADTASIIMQIRTKLSGPMYQAVGMDGEVVGPTNVDVLERDFSACLMPFTYEMYLDVLNGAIERLRDICQDSKDQKSQDQGTGNLSRARANLPKAFSETPTSMGTCIQPRDSESMADAHVYAPLDLSKDSIRLLRLYNGDPGTEIRCEIIESYLSKSEGIPYEALSYTWEGGLTNDSPCILLDGQVFPVTRNLFQALSSLRLPNEDRLLWIDAICINQADHCEKGHQVGQMRHVYQNAERVLIWLGPGTNDTDQLLDTMGVWEKRSHELQKTLPNEKALWKPTVAQLGGLTGSNESGSSRRLQAHVQQMSCGLKSISSKIFSVMPRLMRMDVDDHTQAVLDVMPGPLRKESWWNFDHKLVTLLRKFKDSKATLEHDRIYAFLGIASDAPDLRIDYGCPFQQVVDRAVSVLTLGDAGLGHLIGKRFEPKFPVFFYDLTDTDSFAIRAVALALSGPEKKFLDCLLETPAMRSIAKKALGVWKGDPLYFVSLDYNIFGRVAQYDVELSPQKLFEAGLAICNHYIRNSVLGSEELSKRIVSNTFDITELLCDLQDLLLHPRNGTLNMEWILPAVVRQGYHYQLQLLLEFAIAHGSKLIDYNRRELQICLGYGIEGGHENLLWEAVESGNSETLNILLSRRTSTSQKYLESLTSMLVHVCGTGDEAMLFLLIESGADVEGFMESSERSPLLAAIKNNHPGVVWILAGRGADLGYRDEQGLTPLHHAELLNHGECVLALILYGADEFAKDLLGFTPWQLNPSQPGTCEGRRSKRAISYLFSTVEEKEKHRYIALLEGRDE